MEFPEFFEMFINYMWTYPSTPMSFTVSVATIVESAHILKN